MSYLTDLEAWLSLTESRLNDEVGLRDYQKKAVEDVVQSFALNRSVLLESPCSSGKSLMSKEIVKRMRGDKRVLVIAPSVEILDQMRYTIGLNAAYLSAAICCRKDFAERAKRDGIGNNLGLVVIDEAHSFLDMQKKLYDLFPNAKFLGMTATPERMVGDLTCVYHGHVKTLEPVDMVEMGHITGVEYVKDYWYGNAANVISAYQKYGEGRKMIGFCSSLHEARHIHHAFVKAGYDDFWTIDGSMPKKEREKLIADFRKGAVRGLISVDILTKGFDVPDIGYGFITREVHSRPLALQMIGRLQRKSPGKTSATFVDHAGILSDMVGRDGKVLTESRDIRWEVRGVAI